MTRLFNFKVRSLKVPSERKVRSNGEEETKHSGDCYIVNEDLVCDELENMMEEGGNIVDYHGCNFFPLRWFDRVVVLQTKNSVLFDRLSRSGYTGSKLSNNIECEIFQVLLEEAKESYPQYALKSNSVDDMNENVTTLSDWIRSWSPMSSWYHITPPKFVL